MFSFGLVEFLLARDGDDAADTLAGALLLNAFSANADAWWRASSQAATIS